MKELIQEINILIEKNNLRDYLRFQKVNDSQHSELKIGSSAVLNVKFNRFKNIALLNLDLKKFKFITEN
jgi:hypothetical protein